MSYDFELEDILNSVNKRKNDTPEQPSASEVEPPKASLNDILSEKRERGAEINEALLPSEQAIDEITAPESKPSETEPAEKEKKGVKLSLAPPKFILGAADKAKAIGFKKIGIIICAVLVVILGIFGGIKIADYAKTAYIKEYEDKYKIDFPDGILKEFCDEYGKDQSIVGSLDISDTKTEKLKVYSKYRKSNALLEKGGDIYSGQHIRAIALDDGTADIESVYSTPEGYLSASQEVTFNTIFGTEKYQVVAAYYTNTKPEDDRDYVFPYNTYGTLTKKSFYQFQDRIRNRSLYDTGFKLLEQHYILSISAPSDFMKDFRFVIVCVKTDEDFSKIKKAEANTRIYYPQVWFDKNNQQNPFYLTGKWYPEIIVDSNGKTKQLTAKDFEQES